ncbi:MAG: NUDIX domain-containing protein [Rhodococcus sp.]|nr:NUDIX domain-containing protein [Rhodococcus sp. (in: high G+C Gram-positive bacteria)]
MRGDGDGWATSPDGRRHWGKFGAAGLLLRAPLADGSPAVLLQHRALWSHEGGTWALPGGARDSHESTANAAVREAEEEAGIEAQKITVRGEAVTMEVPGGWSYTTVMADAPEPLATILNGESTELRWVPESKVAHLPLHPGFEDGWTRLRTQGFSVNPDDVDQLADRGVTIPRTIALPTGGFGWLRPRTEAVETSSDDIVDAATVLGWLDLSDAN